ncbi:hypothetical protein AB0M20_10030, partial [Actinoplanes sp. NPDC051633]
NQELQKHIHQLEDEIDPMRQENDATPLSVAQRPSKLMSSGTHRADNRGGARPPASTVTAWSGSTSG